MTNFFQKIIVLREYNEIKEEIKNPEDTVEYIYIYIHIYIYIYIYKSNGNILCRL